MTSSILKILKAESFFLDFADFRDLIKPQWPFIGPRLWITYRLISSFYLLAVLVWAIYVKFAKYQFIFFVYVSHWAFLALVFSHVFKLICALKYYKWLNNDAYNVKEKSPLIRRKPSWHLERPTVKVPTLLQVNWLLSNIAILFAFHVTFGYMDTFINGFKKPVFTEINFQIHGINAIVALIDLLLIAQPTFLLHVYQPLLFYGIYEAFTAFYYVAGGKEKNGTPVLYDNLDWTRPLEPAITDVLISGAIITIYHVVIWLVSVWRQWIGSCVRKPDKTLEYLGV